MTTALHKMSANIKCFLQPFPHIVFLLIICLCPCWRHSPFVPALCLHQSLHTCFQDGPPAPAQGAASSVPWTQIMTDVPAVCPDKTDQLNSEWLVRSEAWALLSRADTWNLLRMHICFKRTVWCKHDNEVIFAWPWRRCINISLTERRLDHRSGRGVNARWLWQSVTP